LGRRSGRQLDSGKADSINVDHNKGYCLDLKTQVQTPQGLKDVSNIQVGDLVLSNIGYNEVMNVFPKIKKKSYKITLQDGKEIICSEEHLFPTENGELNIKGGLKEGMCLYVKE
jgi:sRNA-binding protein